MQRSSALLPLARSLSAAALTLVWLLTPILLRGANPDELELTLEVTAHGAANIANAIEDQCEMHFTARLVFAPDPKTGRYGDPVQETYTMTASGSGHVLDIESWTYSALQPTPGTVSLNYYPDEGRATIGWGYLDSFIRSEPEGGQGSERLARTAIKLADDDINQQPDAGEVRFKPNTASFTARGSTQGQYQDILGHGEMSATFTLMRGGERVEAIILRPAGYETWVPHGGPDQSLPGTNHLVVTAVLRMPGTTAPPPVRKARFRFELVEGSKEPGLCLNAPSPAEAHQHYDLQFASAGTVDPSANRVQHVTEDLATEASVVLFCYDYGAFAQLRVTAITDTGEEIPAHVEGEPDTPTLRLPQDENHNRVADAWERAQGTWGKIQDPAWDGADEPNDHEVPGDGISLYERYRGFRFGQTHERLAARRKHVFVYDPDGLVHSNLDSVMSFAAASGLEVRFVEDETWTGPGPAGSDKRVVNFNTSGFGHAVDQHALHVRLVFSPTPALAGDFQAMWRAKYGKSLNRDISSYYGFTYHDVTGGKWAEAPRSAFAIELYPWGIDRISREFVRYHTFGLSQFANYDAEPADEQARLLAELDKLTDAHIRANADDWEEQNYLYLLAGTSHELGHGVGIDDLRPPHDGGPWSCYMRYLDWDFLPNPLDRMELDARWRHLPTDRGLRNRWRPSPAKLHHQIHVTDRQTRDVPLRACLLQPRLPHRTAPASIPTRERRSGARPQAACACTRPFQPWTRRRYASRRCWLGMRRWPATPCGSRCGSPPRARELPGPRRCWKGAPVRAPPVSPRLPPIGLRESASSSAVSRPTVPAPRSSEPGPGTHSVGPWRLTLRRGRSVWARARASSSPIPQPCRSRRVSTCWLSRGTVVATSSRRRCLRGASLRAGNFALPSWRRLTPPRGRATCEGGPTRRGTWVGWGRRTSGAVKRSRCVPPTAVGRHWIPCLWWRRRSSVSETTSAPHRRSRSSATRGRRANCTSSRRKPGGFWTRWLRRCTSCAASARKAHPCSRCLAIPARSMKCRFPAISGPGGSWIGA
ncbi:MAG: hypothetical protein HS113_26165 [Verrucomicrobiales bacterium]|nr:hypothetical protein [Verrucomicrobiales bacterium]